MNQNLKPYRKTQQTQNNSFSKFSLEVLMPMELQRIYVEQITY